MQVVPEVVALTAPFWGGARDGRLMLQRCMACGMHWHPPEHICPRCQSDHIEWVPAAGSGTVYSYTIVVHSTHVAFDEKTPYLVALVDLVEGPRIVSGIRGCAPENVYVGMPVVVTFETAGAVHLPQFLPRHVTGSGHVETDSKEAGDERI